MGNVRIVVDPTHESIADRTLRLKVEAEAEALIDEGWEANGIVVTTSPQGFTHYTILMTRGAEPRRESLGARRSPRPRNRITDRSVSDPNS